MDIAFIVLSVVLGVAFAGAAVPTLQRREPFRGNFERLRVPPRLGTFIALAELAAGLALIAGIWWRPIGIAAAVGLVLLLVGALGYHARAKDPASQYAAPVVLGLMSAATVGVGLAA